MYDEEYDPLLVQVPLTVSPFVSLPTATTLPYTYKSLPPALPPSSLVEYGDPSTADPRKPKFVVAASGHAAHPDEIVASCEALQAHMQRQTRDAQAAMDKWEESIKERELAEKRRVAPGWLDRDEKILQPARAPRTSVSGGVEPTSATQPQHDQANTQPVKDPNVPDEGEELDRAFGAMAMK